MTRRPAASYASSSRDDAEHRQITQALGSWFARAARTLPWRTHRDPYTTWLSEIMLQQTRIDQALPYFDRFVGRFPDVHRLASASLDEVLHAWEGLGYYSRARNLHRAARIVVEEHQGHIPSTYDELKSLPGIGSYSAAAIASQAFGLPHAAVDGNVTRVLARLSAESGVVTQNPARRRIDGLADALLDQRSPGSHNEALMELGATICRPKAPTCGECPISRWCAGLAEGNPEAYPVKLPRKPVPHHDIAVGVIRDETGRVLIQRRPDEAMLGGLWEFPGGKCEPGESPEDACRRELAEELGIEVEVEGPITTVDHAYSHFRITLHAFECRITNGQPAPGNDEPMKWVVAEELARYAFPRANRRLIDHLSAREAPSDVRKALQNTRDAHGDAAG